MGGLINALTIMIALTWGLLVACLATLVFLPLLANLPFLAVLPQEIFSVGAFVIAIFVAWSFVFLLTSLSAVARLLKVASRRRTVR